MYICFPTLSLMEKQMLYYTAVKSKKKKNNIQAKKHMKTPMQPSSFKLTQQRIYQEWDTYEDKVAP